MRSREVDILFVPGWTSSGPDHWQTRWQARLSTARRVEQHDWERPVLAAWTERLVEEVGSASRPVVLIAHSLGVLLVANAARKLPPGAVAGAYLVAPPDASEIAQNAEIDRAFAETRFEPLPFPAVIVASRTDPWCRYEVAEAMAAALGARIADAGDSGHIDTASGHGPWPDGALHFAKFLAGLRQPEPAGVPS